jgi:hypothetical protein
MTTTTKTRKAPEKHGATSGGPSGEYTAWVHMIGRCENPNDAKFASYAGRGIKVCEKWRRSFAAFLADVGPRPSPSHSLDRFPNNDGDYEPGNVRWATPSQQQRNTRRNRLVTFGGVKLPLVAWCERFGLDYHVVRDRLEYGWTVDRALTTPVLRRGRVVNEFDRLRERRTRRRSPER